MQENLFKILSNSCNSMVDNSLPQLDFQCKEIDKVSKIFSFIGKSSLHVSFTDFTGIMVLIYFKTHGV